MESKIEEAKNKLIVALDVFTFEEARALIDVLVDQVDIFKIGSQLFTACGPVVVRYVLAQGKKVFLDLKFHDIPNTVAHAVRSALQMGQADGSQKTIFMCTLHTIGGEEMLARAAQAVEQGAREFGVPKPLLLGITVLTSDAGGDNLAQTVLQRCSLAKKAGLDGVVASSQEAQLIRTTFKEDLIIVTPGIRPSGSQAGDQKRVTTPSDAITNGSDYLVVGRPIVNAVDPAKAASDILRDIADALERKHRF